MSTIVTRAGKGSPLTNNEVDDNFVNLNTDKYQAGDALGTPSSGTLTNCSGLPQSGVVDLTSDLALKAPLASPTFTGTPAAPTAAADTNTTQIATTAYVIGQGYLKSATAASTYVALTGDQTIAGTKTFSSTITGSISGNAGTVTNGVYTTGSYANPAWITSLSETKVLPAQTGNSGKYLTTNGTSTSWATLDLSLYAPLASPTFTGIPAAPTAAVDTNTTQLATTAFVIGQGYLKSATAASTYVALTGDQTIAGTKTFSSTISGSISGNAGTVTNGVYTSGSYSNPTWITSLAETKVLPSQTGNSGKFLTTNGTSTSWGTVTAPNDGTLTLAVSGTGLSGSQTFTANQSTNATFTVTSNATSANTASTIVARDASGNFTAGTITATLSGNASTVTNGVYTTGSYADPAWITSIAGSKVSGNISGNAGTVTNGVYTTGTQTITGDKTFSGSANRIGAFNVGTNDIYVYEGATNAFYVRTGASGAYKYTAIAANGDMSIQGNFTATGNVTANSDERLKTNVQTIEGALAKVESARGVTYNWKANGSAGIGVIAQEIQKVAPEAVIVGDDGILSVAYGNLVGLLIEAVKELSLEVKELKQKVGE